MLHGPDAGGYRYAKLVALSQRAEFLYGATGDRYQCRRRFSALLIAHERWAFPRRYAPMVRLAPTIGAYFAADDL
jgi:hypothetical protein